MGGWLPSLTFAFGGFICMGISGATAGTPASRVQPSFGSCSDRAQAFRRAFRASGSTRMGTPNQAVEQTGGSGFRELLLA